MLKEIKSILIQRAELLAIERSEAYLNEAYRVVWQTETIQQFENNLGLKKSVRSEEDCSFDRHVISTLTYPEQSIDQYVWSYFSLYSVSSRNIFLQPVITQSIHKQLLNLFDKVDMLVINNVPRKCFSLKNTIILGNEDEVLVVQPVETPYLLEEHGKRWRDLLKLNYNELKNNFRLVQCRLFTTCRIFYDSLCFNRAINSYCSTFYIE